MTETDLRLQAIDGTNPLGWMAAMGVMVILANTKTTELPEARIRWTYEGLWIPVLEGVDAQQLVQRCLRDLVEVTQRPAFTQMVYEKDGKGALQRDLKPPPGFFRAYLNSLVRASDNRGLNLASAFATDIAVDGKGNTKPTALHFTSGQQQFLLIADELATRLEEGDFREALFEGWSYDKECKTFMWDASSYRDYALRADDPSSAKKGTVPGADWLAFRGLECLRCAPRGQSIMTTLCTGSGNHMQMHWPLWRPALDLSEVDSLLGSSELKTLSRVERNARGVSAVFEAAIVRSDQGYGAFAPPSLVLAPDSP